MITQVIVNHCTKCQSEHIVKNGKTKAGKQKYHCKACNAYGTLAPSVQYTPERKAEILRAYHERASLRGIERTFGVAYQTVAKWLKEKADSLPEMPPWKASQADDVLQLDELCSFVESQKTNAGFGQPCAVEHVKLFPISLATGVKKAAGVCGLGYQLLIDIVPLSVTFGKGMNRFLAYWARHMSRLVKRRAKQHMLRDGTIHCGKNWGGLFAKHSRFESRCIS